MCQKLFCSALIVFVSLVTNGRAQDPTPPATVAGGDPAAGAGGAAPAAVDPGAPVVPAGTVPAAGGVVPAAPATGVAPAPAAPVAPAGSAPTAATPTGPIDEVDIASCNDVALLREFVFELRKRQARVDVHERKLQGDLAKKPGDRELKVLWAEALITWADLEKLIISAEKRIAGLTGTRVNLIATNEMAKLAVQRLNGTNPAPATAPVPAGSATAPIVAVTPPAGAP